MKPLLLDLVKHSYDGPWVPVRGEDGIVTTEGMASGDLVEIYLRNGDGDGKRSAIILGDGKTTLDVTKVEYIKARCVKSGGGPISVWVS